MNLDDCDPLVARILVLWLLCLPNSSSEEKGDASDLAATNPIKLLAARQAAREHSRAATHLFALEPVLPFSSSRKQ